MSLRQKSRTNPVVVILLSFLCVVLVAVAAYLAMGNLGGDDTVKPAFRVEGLDPAAQTGRMPGTPRNEKSPGPDQFGYRINLNPSFASDGNGGNILVQNPAFNNYLMVLEIADENGDVLYQSQFLAPNQYIEKIDLQKPLESGGYPATAYINAVDPKTLDLVEAFECRLNLIIK